MAFLRQTALVALVTALATVLIGWWTVPVIAFVWTMVVPRRGAVLSAAIGAGVAWTTLLVIAANGGPLIELATLLGQILSVSGSAVLTLTVAYAALLAGSAALVAQAIRPPARAFTERTTASSPSR